MSPSLRGHVQALSHCYPYWISPGQGNKERLYKLHTGIRRISAFFEDLYQNIEVQRVEELQANSRSSLLKTVIVGAGPVGLLNAIEHYKQGVSVAVLEKRQNYTRDVWFDIYDRPFSIGLKKLKQWGYVHLDIEARRFQQEHRQVGVIAVRAQVLERFLAKIVGLLDIRLIYGHQFLALCANPHTTETADMVRYSAGRAIFLNCMYSGMLDDRKLDVGSDNALFWCSKTPNELAVHFSRDADHWREVEASFLFMDFDLLIGADGTSSRVRHFAHIPYIQQHSFILSGINITVPGLHQTTLIVNFKPISHGRLQDDNQCIEINRRVRQDYPGLAIDGVTSVWKRFYFSHCQMQILFTQDYGNKIIDAYFGSRDEYRNYQQKKSYDNMRLVFWKNEQNTGNVLLQEEEGEEEEVIFRTDEGKSLPWEKLREISNLVLAKRFRTKKSLQKAIMLRQGGAAQATKGNNNQKEVIPRYEYDTQLFDVEIYRAAANNVFVRSHDSSTLPQMVPAIVSLVGDSSISAHYR